MIAVVHQGTQSLLHASNSNVRFRPTLAMTLLYAESSLSPSSLKVTEIAAKSAVVSWVPASSNLEHAVSVDGEAPTIISRTCFVCYISGSSAHLHRVSHVFAQFRLIGGIMLSTCPSVRLSVRLLPNL